MADGQASTIVGRSVVAFALTLTTLIHRAAAGPPYATDDPEPTDYWHYEVYVFSGGISARLPATGIDT